MVYHNICSLEWARAQFKCIYEREMQQATIEGQLKSFSVKQKNVKKRIKDPSANITFAEIHVKNFHKAQNERVSILNKLGARACIVVAELLRHLITNSTLCGLSSISDLTCTHSEETRQLPGVGVVTRGHCLTDVDPGHLNLPWDAS